MVEQSARCAGSYFALAYQPHESAPCLQDKDRGVAWLVHPVQEWLSLEYFEAGLVQQGFYAIQAAHGYMLMDFLSTMNKEV
jgi:hypothetical protein